MRRRGLTGWTGTFCSMDARDIRVQVASHNFVVLNRVQFLLFCVALYLFTLNAAKAYTHAFVYQFSPLLLRKDNTERLNELTELSPPSGVQWKSDFDFLITCVIKWGSAVLPACLQLAHAVANYVDLDRCNAMTLCVYDCSHLLCLFIVSCVDCMSQIFCSYMWLACGQRRTRY